MPARPRARRDTEAEVRDVRVGSALRVMALVPRRRVHLHSRPPHRSPARGRRALSSLTCHPAAAPSAQRAALSYSRPGRHPLRVRIIFAARFLPSYPRPCTSPSRSTAPAGTRRLAPAGGRPP